MKNNRELSRKEFLSKLLKYSSAAAAGVLVISASGCESDLLNHGTYEVDADKCTGCADCISACRYSAISMSGAVATISSSKCVGCGQCPRYCDHGAISKS